MKHNVMLMEENMEHNQDPVSLQHMMQLSCHLCAKVCTYKHVLNSSNYHLWKAIKKTNRHAALIKIKQPCEKKKNVLSLLDCLLSIFLHTSRAIAYF